MPTIADYLPKGWYDMPMAEEGASPRLVWVWCGDTWALHTVGALEAPAEALSGVLSAGRAWRSAKADFP